MYAISDFAGNKDQIRAEMKQLHTAHFKGALDFTGHLSPGSFLLAHPEYFSVLISWPRHGPIGVSRRFHRGPKMRISLIRRKRGVVYIADPDGSMFQKLKALEAFVGHAELDGRPAVRVLLRHHEHDYGVMRDTFALDFDRPEVQEWYIDTLKDWVRARQGSSDDDNDAVDGIRFDLSAFLFRKNGRSHEASEEMSDEFWWRVEQALYDVVPPGRQVTIWYEDYRSLEHKKVLIERSRQLRPRIMSYYYNPCGSGTFSQKKFFLAGLPRNDSEYYSIRGRRGFHQSNELS